MDGNREGRPAGSSVRGCLARMASCARLAARPGWIWVAGVGYPTWGEYVARVYSMFEGDFAGPLSDLASQPLWWLVTPPILWLVCRLVAGLARLSPPVVWERLRGDHHAPPLRRVFAAGRGLTLAALGLWVLLFATVLLVAVALALPFSLAMQILGLGDAATAILFSPLFAFLIVYGVLLSVLHQLALHSLVHNRRGVASALLHAWRIARASPQDTFFAAIGDAVLSIAVFLSTGVVGGLFGGLPLLAQVLQLALLGFAGVARAGYWARTYRALGGLSPDDGVPGL